MYLDEYKQKSTFAHAYHMEFKNCVNETVITNSKLDDLILLHSNHYIAKIHSSY